MWRRRAPAGTGQTQGSAWGGDRLRDSGGATTAGLARAPLAWRSRPGAPPAEPLSREPSALSLQPPASADPHRWVPQTQCAYILCPQCPPHAVSPAPPPRPAAPAAARLLTRRARAAAGAAMSVQTGRGGAGAPWRLEAAAEEWPHWGAILGALGSNEG